MWKLWEDGALSNDRGDYVLSVKGWDIEFWKAENMEKEQKHNARKS